MPSKTTSTTKTSPDGTITITTVTIITPDGAPAAPEGGDDSAGDKCVFAKFYSSPSAAPQKVNRGGEVTKEFLSGALNADVISFDTKICAGGQLGYTVLIRNIKYASGSDRPQSCVYKSHPLGEAQRALSSGPACHLRETYFYEKGYKDYPGPTPEPIFVVKDSSDLAVFFNVIMEDMNENYELLGDYGEEVDDQTLEDLIIDVAVPMHAKFWNDKKFLEKPPITNDGPIFKQLYVPPELIEPFAGGAYKTFMEQAPAACFPELGGKFPPMMQRSMEYAGKLAENGGAGMKKFFEEAIKILNTRPMTWVHGDLKPDNVWKLKKDPKIKALGDWQLYRMGPPIFDFFTALLSVDPEKAGNGKGRALFAKYHEAMSKHVPTISEEMPIQHLIDDISILSMTCIPWFCCFFVGIIADEDMPKEKKEFTLHQFAPLMLRAWAGIFDEFGGYEVMDSVLAGTYKNLGSRKF